MNHGKITTLATLQISSTSLGKHLSGATKIVFDSVQLCITSTKINPTVEEIRFVIFLSWSTFVSIFLARKSKSNIYAELFLKQLVETCQRPSTGPASGSHVLSESPMVNSTWKYNWLDNQCSKAPAIVLRHRLCTAFLLSASIAHSCPVHVSWLHVAVCLEEGGCWNVRGKKYYLWCCMQPSYNASKGSKHASWQDLHLLYCNSNAAA